MATDFFQRQAVARRNTWWLVFLFLLAVVLIVGAVVAVTMVVLSYAGGEEYANVFNQLTSGGDLAYFPWEIPGWAGGATLALLGGGTLFKVSALRMGGGSSVAEGLGGKRLYPSSIDRTERRVLNVVEEMALASGTPVPPVYLLEEAGINAFAAGFSPSDAVIGVTRGCAETLSRDELQGVIAHEFSHILNGDMQMSIRLIGILHGILLIGLIGHTLLRIFFYTGDVSSRRRNDDGDGKGGSAVLVLIGISIALIVIGSIGSLLGGLIKAAVSRQREYLADASAVQFTRNPEGIAGALKRIGSVVYGSKLKHPRAAEVSHMYFATGVWEGFTDLTATHPPLPKRIRAIDPNWDGTFPKADRAKAQTTKTSKQASNFAGTQAEAPEAAAQTTTPTAKQTIPLAVVDHAVDQVGEPTDDHRQYAAELLASIDPLLKQSAREPYGARAVLYGLLLDGDLDIRAQQFLALDKHGERGMADLTRQLTPKLTSIDPRARLPLVDLSLPALRALSPPQYQAFRRCFTELVRADNRLGLFEWTLSQVMLRHLRPQFERVRSPITRYYGLQKLGKPCSVLLSTLAYAGHTEQEAAAAFADAAALLPNASCQLLPKAACNLNELDAALRTLASVAAKHRGRLIDACAASICADGHVAIQEAELLRGISDLLDCPMPPLLAGQSVEGSL